MSRLILAAFVLLATVTASNAQRSTYRQMMDFNRIITNNTNNEMMMKNMCEQWRKKGEKIPPECNKYFSSGSSGGSGTAAGHGTAEKGKLKFTPTSGDTSMQQFADSNGGTAEERQFLLQIANAAKVLLEERYSSKGWTNNVAGSLAFFIVSNMTVYAGKEPSETSQQVLFEALDTTLSQSPEFTATANHDRQAIYNTLIAYSGFPMVLYAEGAQKGDKTQIQKARTIAAGYIKKILNVEPESLEYLVR